MIAKIFDRTYCSIEATPAGEPAKDDADTAAKGTREEGKKGLGDFGGQGGLIDALFGVDLEET